MSPSCPGFEVLQGLAQAPQDVRAHVRVCDSCRSTQDALGQTQGLLAELVRAEQDTRPPDLWAGITTRLDQPRLVERLPLALAGWLRTGAEIGRPAARSALAAGVLGIVLGSWLGTSLWQQPRRATESEPWVVSSLFQDPQRGVARMYLQSFDGEENQDDRWDRDSSETLEGTP